MTITLQVLSKYLYYLVTWLFGYLVIWLFRLFGYLVIWLFGYLVIWLFGYLVIKNLSINIINIKIIFYLVLTSSLLLIYLSLIKKIFFIV